MEPSLLGQLSSPDSLTGTAAIAPHMSEAGGDMIATANYTGERRLLDSTSERLLTTLRQQDAGSVERSDRESVSLALFDSIGVRQSLETGAPKTRSLNLWQFSLMLFLVTAAGPFGIESLVRSSAPLYAVIALLVVPVIYCLPQSLMCAELSAMIPSNHGSIAWVYRALGPMAGFFYSVNDAMSTWIDTPSYPVLIASYANETFVNPEHNQWFSFSIRIGFVVLGFVLTAMNVKVVGQSSYFMTAVIMLPFFVAFFMSVSDIHVSDWMRTKTIKDEIDWPLYISSAIWLHTGWDTMSHVSGEVNFSLSKFSSGFLCAIVLDFVSYVIPLMTLFAVAYRRDADEEHKWKEGFILDGMKKVSSWLGPWVLLGAVASNFGIYSMEVTTLSREIWALSQPSAPLSESRVDLEEVDIGVLPLWMGALWKRTEAPVVAVAIISLVNLFLVNLPFGFLIEMSTFQNCLSFVLEYTSFLYLRYKEPNEPRPFRVPFGLFGAWMVTVVKLCFVCTLFVVTIIKKPLIFVLGVGFNVVVLLPYYWIVLRPSNLRKQKIRKAAKRRSIDECDISPQRL